MGRRLALGLAALALALVARGAAGEDVALAPAEVESLDELRGC